MMTDPIEAGGVFALILGTFRSVEAAVMKIVNREEVKRKDKSREVIDNTHEMVRDMTKFMLPSVEKYQDKIVTQNETMVSLMQKMEAHLKKISSISNGNID